MALITQSRSGPRHRLGKFPCPASSSLYLAEEVASSTRSTSRLVGTYVTSRIMKYAHASHGIQHLHTRDKTDPLASSAFRLFTMAGAKKMVHYLLHPNQLRSMVQWYVSVPPWPCGAFADSATRRLGSATGNYGTSRSTLATRARKGRPRRHATTTLISPHAPFPPSSKSCTQSCFSQCVSSTWSCGAWTPSRTT